MGLPVLTFDATIMFREGRIVPRHLLWSGRVRGQLYVAERQDVERGRTMRIAQLVGVQHDDLLPPLHDAVLISCRPAWWVLSGWESVETGPLSLPQSFSQTWILKPAG